MRISRLLVVALLLSTGCVAEAAAPLSVFQIEVRFILLNRKDVDSIVRQRSMISADEVTDLYRDGKGAMLYPPLLVMTTPGVEAVVDAAVEWLSPTDFSVGLTPEIVNSNRPSGSVIGALVHPTDFQLNAVGPTFRAEPVLSEDGEHMELKFRCKVVTELEPNQYAGVYVDNKGNETRVSVDQVRLKSLVVESTLPIRDGTRTVLGSQDYEEQGEVLFVVLTVEIKEF